PALMWHDLMHTSGDIIWSNNTAFTFQGGNPSCQGRVEFQMNSSAATCFAFSNKYSTRFFECLLDARHDIAIRLFQLPFKSFDHGSVSRRKCSKRLARNLD